MHGYQTTGWVVPAADGRGDKKEPTNKHEPCHQIWQVRSSAAHMREPTVRNGESKRWLGP